jgi:NAD(P)H-hydrate epimerase
VILNRKQIRLVDEIAIQRYGIPSVVLMENAGRGVAETLIGLGIDGPVVIICGKGNNGGDGFVIARHLELGGYSCEVVLCCQPEKLQGDAKTNFVPLQRVGIPITVITDRSQVGRLDRSLASADWIVDALLGTGAAGPLRTPLDTVLEKVNLARTKKLAVDVPTGLDCDTGLADANAFRADHTCTFVAAKPGLVTDGSARHVGRLHVLQIGAPRQVILDALAS